MHKPVLGPPPIGRLVRQQQRGTADPEEAIGNEHGFLVPKVPILSNVLSANNHSISIPMNLQKVLGKIDRNNPSTAPHPSQIKAPNVPSQFVLINNHGRERGRRVKQATIHNKNTNILRLKASVVEEIIQGTKHDLFRLRSGRSHRRLRRNRVHGLGDVGLLPETRPFQDLALEIQGRLLEVSREAGMVHETPEGGFEVLGGAEAGGVQEVDGAWARDGVKREAKNEDGGAGEDGEEVVLEVEPEVVEVGGLGDLD